ncbi:acetyl-CoA carboxylase biotin carboxyl carrier protein subunit [Rhizobium sp. LCM 4573]|uniref:acetyl-CoA carboxylase biotin carboxyl carrier protein n=1 Tax=Rhizobium sp. LCM 4573 TaxID=1848291 RepID=UPI0008DA5C93|nr:acetyl-CoA carboxylase biotin carboxyl carrier protein subunit [Rhizobium sp. LCM 4573]OHV80523.1 acetyl-CoA carboxylase biotin carboxyl carrier protein subunit [Rhizobium sp. LCM 4573]
MDLDKIKKLIEFVGASRVSELTVTENGTSVRIVREDKTTSPLHHAPQAAETEPAPKSAGEELANSPAPVISPSKVVAAPSFGLFHRAPSPGSPPFVEIGDRIEAGQELFIIEAMKVFSTVRAERGGKVARFLADDGEDVELGQPVLELE